MSLEKIRHNVEQLGTHLHYLIDSYHAGDTRKNTVDNILLETNALIDAQIKAEADRKIRAVKVPETVPPPPKPTSPWGAPPEPEKTLKKIREKRK
jgi:hypothetical protein